VIKKDGEVLMDKEEIIRRLKKLSEHAVHTVGELPYIMSLDDGIALDEAVQLLEEMETKVHELSKEEWEEWKNNCNRDPICSVWKDDYTPMWHLKPEDIHEPAFLMGVLKLYNGKPKREDIKWA